MYTSVLQYSVETWEEIQCSVSRGASYPGLREKQKRFHREGVIGCYQVKKSCRVGPPGMVALPD